MSCMEFCIKSTALDCLHFRLNEGLTVGDSFASGSCFVKSSGQFCSSEVSVTNCHNWCIWHFDIIVGRVGDSGAFRGGAKDGVKGLNGVAISMRRKNSCGKSKKIESAVAISGQYFCGSGGGAALVLPGSTRAPV